MTHRIRWIALAFFAVTAVWLLDGNVARSQGTPGKAQDKAGKKDAAKDDHAHDDGKPLTEKDVKMPTTFKDGVARLEELQKNVKKQIDSNKLDTVHHIAEEMALVANGTKKLAAKEVPTAKQADAGRLLNEIASSYHPIDEAADAGNRKETEVIHAKMGKAIEQLKALQK